LTDESILAAIGGEDGVAFLRSLQAIVQAVEAQQQLAA
jgi:hypothetical protein